MWGVGGEELRGSADGATGVCVMCEISFTLNDITSFSRARGQHVRHPGLSAHSPRWPRGMISIGSSALNQATVCSRTSFDIDKTSIFCYDCRAEFDYRLRLSDKF